MTATLYICRPAQNLCKTTQNLLQNQNHTQTSCTATQRALDYRFFCFWCKRFVWPWHFFFVFFCFLYTSVFTSHQQAVSCPLAPSVGSPASLERYQPWQSMPLALCLVVAVTATPAAFASCHVLPWLPACKARKPKKKNIKEVDTKPFFKHNYNSEVQKWQNNIFCKQTLQGH